MRHKFISNNKNNMKLKLTVLTVVFATSIVACSKNDSSETFVNDTQSIKESVDKSEINAENSTLYLEAKGWEGGENVITLNINHPIFNETFYYFKLEPGTYRVECELTNPKIPFAGLLFQGTETIKNIDINGMEYETFPEIKNYDFNEGGNLEETVVLDQEVYFQGSDNAIFTFYKLD